MRSLTAQRDQDKVVTAAQTHDVARGEDATGAVAVVADGGRVVAPAFERAVDAVRATPWTRISFVVVVVLPIVAVAFYSVFWASSRYVSEFRVAIRSVQPIKTDGLAEMFGVGGMSQSGNDANAVVQYLHSRDSFESLEKKFPLREKLTDGSIDIFSRFLGRFEIEALTRYWNSMIEAFYEMSTGTIVVRVTAFSPDDALSLARLMLADSENLVNRMSRRTREDTVAFAEGEVSKAEMRLAGVRKKLQTLQDKEAMLDPLKTAEVNSGLASRIKEQIAQRNAELATMRLQLAPNAPSVRAAEVAVAGLKRELENIESQATATSGSSGRTERPTERPLSEVFGAFQQMSDERSFAEKAYQSALTSLETARMEANRQQVYLSVIVPPGLPQEVSYPRPLRQIAITAMIALALWLVGLLAVYSVREHM